MANYLQQPIIIIYKTNYILFGLFAYKSDKLE